MSKSSSGSKRKCSVTKLFFKLIKQLPTAFRSFWCLARQYRNITELTTPVLNAFIEKAIVHAPYKENGKRKMTMDIYFRFIGNFKNTNRRRICK